MFHLGLLLNLASMKNNLEKSFKMFTISKNCFINLQSRSLRCKKRDTKNIEYISVYISIFIFIFEILFLHVALCTILFLPLQGCKFTNLYISWLLFQRKPLDCKCSSSSVDKLRFSAKYLRSRTTIMYRWKLCRTPNVGGRSSYLP